MSEFNSNLQGGNATVTWTWGPYPPFSSTFCIDGLNPAQSVVSPYADAINSYWDIPKLIAQESSWLQFLNGQPYTDGGSQPGFGLMQLTNPKPTSSQIWNWQQDVTAGLSLFSSNQATGNSNWQIYQSAYAAFLNQGGSALPPANDVENYCTFSYTPDGVSTHSFADANVLKAYNGNGNGNYMAWSTADKQWVATPLGPLGTDYVAAVCSHSDTY